MRLVLVRHAETVANAEGRIQGHADYELSAVGREQAMKLQRRLVAEEFLPTHVYSSPLRRSAETAEIVTRPWDVEVRFCDDLMEYDVGIMSGLTWEEAKRRHPEIDTELERWRQISGVEGAEPLAGRRRRADRVVRWILKAHTDGDVVLIVSHGGIMSHIISALLGTDRTWGLPTRNAALFDFSIDLERWSLGDDDRFNTSISRVNLFNDGSHLD